MLWKYDVSEETQGWILDNFAWAIRQGLLTPQTPLVKPTREFFTAKGGQGRATAEQTLQNIKELLGVGSEDIGLLEIDRVPAEYRYEYGVLMEVSGTWHRDVEGAVIQYDPEMLGRPFQFAAIMAHEVLHHVLHRTSLDMPGMPEAEELCTDLHCITMGFGLVQIAGAEQAGWMGYMRQSSRVFALAVFLRLKDINDREALSLVSGRVRRQLRRAFRELEKSNGQMQCLKRSLAAS